MSWPYDYIIIGAGSAGCAIANRLAEDLALRILIIEAGPPDSSFMLKMPAGFASPRNWALPRRSRTRSASTGTTLDTTWAAAFWR